MFIRGYAPMHVFIHGWRVARIVCIIWFCACQRGPTQVCLAWRLLLPYVSWFISQLGICPVGFILSYKCLFQTHCTFGRNLRTLICSWWFSFRFLISGVFGGGSKVSRIFLSLSILRELLIFFISSDPPINVLSTLVVGLIYSSALIWWVSSGSFSSQSFPWFLGYPKFS